jgi:hypothetical protein
LAACLLSERVLVDAAGPDDERRPVRSDAGVDHTGLRIIDGMS